MNTGHDSEMSHVLGEPVMSVSLLSLIHPNALVWEGRGDFNRLPFKRLKII